MNLENERMYLIGNLEHHNFYFYDAKTNKFTSLIEITAKKLRKIKKLIKLQRFVKLYIRLPTLWKIA